MIKENLSYKKIDDEKSFIINSYPFSESSLLIEVFTQNYGRLTLIARGARKRTSQLRGMITLFVPVSISFFGKKEILTLHKIEWIGGWPQLKGKTIISGFYVNELIIKLFAKEDPHPKTFEYLTNIMQSLACNPENQNYNLRIFEWKILQETGFISNLTIDNKQQKIEKDYLYLIKPNCLPIKLLNNTYQINDEEIIVKGSVLEKLRLGNFNHNELNTILKINRMLLNYITNSNLNTKFLLNQFNEIKNTKYLGIK